MLAFSDEIKLMAKLQEKSPMKPRPVQRFGCDAAFFESDGYRPVPRADRRGNVRMARDGKVRVGIIGSQFQADIHAASLQIMPEEAEAVAIASPTPGNASALAKRFGVPR